MLLSIYLIMTSEIPDLQGIATEDPIPSLDIKVVGLLYLVLMITNPSVKICPSNVALKHDLQTGLTGVYDLY